MFRTIEDFSNSWKYEAEETHKLFTNLTNESLNQKVTEDGRALGFLAWHIAQTMPEMLGEVGLKINGPGWDTSCPESAEEIAEAFLQAANSVLEEVTANWNDETLKEIDTMYGEQWSRGTTLFNLVLHQTHHRGQITVLMRQAGLRVNGIYGPAKEDWASMGMPAMA
ncbi:MAG: DinB family protein [Pyrinomonadaceae bacterium]